MGWALAMGTALLVVLPLQGCPHPAPPTSRPQPPPGSIAVDLDEIARKLGAPAWPPGTGECEGFELRGPPTIVGAVCGPHAVQLIVGLAFVDGLSDAEVRELGVSSLARIRPDATMAVEMRPVRDGELGVAVLRVGDRVWAETAGTEQLGMTVGFVCVGPEVADGRGAFCDALLEALIEVPNLDQPTRDESLGFSLSAQFGELDLPPRATVGFGEAWAGESDRVALRREAPLHSGSLSDPGAVASVVSSLDARLLSCLDARAIELRRYDERLPVSFYLSPGASSPGVGLPSAKGSACVESVLDGLPAWPAVDESVTIDVVWVVRRLSP